MGMQPPSPAPTPMRKSSNWTKFWATPHRAVMRDQAPMATASRLERLNRSAKRAAGMPDSE